MTCSYSTPHFSLSQAFLQGHPGCCEALCLLVDHLDFPEHSAFLSKHIQATEQGIKWEQNIFHILALFPSYTSKGYPFPSSWKRLLQRSFKMFSFLLKATTNIFRFFWGNTEMKTVIFSFCENSTFGGGESIFHWHAYKLWLFLFMSVLRRNPANGSFTDLENNE